MSQKELTKKDFANLFGIMEADLPAGSLYLIDKGDWRYKEIKGEELEKVTSNFLERLDNREFSFVVKGDKARWDRGWGENLKNFKAANGQESTLSPKYIRAGLPMRLNGKFVRSVSPTFELDWFKVFQQWIFKEYFSKYNTIVELGCGSGINVATLAQMFPEKKIIGADWAVSSKNIVEEMHNIHGWNTDGRVFDFFKPDYSWQLEGDFAILTIGAMEQTGIDHDDVIDWILVKKPSLCVFIEPVLDWYDTHNSVDLLAIKAHKLRNFWQGFPKRLKKLELEGRVEIIKEKRSNFGSLVLEGYSQIIWRPL
jgi:hypothetical protein